jgi:hypothetical protein
MNIKLIQKPKEKPKPEADLSKEKLLVIDNGMYPMIAQHCAKWFGHVWYTKPIAAAFLESSQHVIGRGFDDIEWVPDYKKYIDKATVILYPDVNYQEDQIYYKRHGYNVCGALGGEIMELDKHYFIDELHKAGLPVPKTWYFEGLDATWEFLKNKHEKLWIKAAERYRSDWETDYHEDPFQTEVVFNEKRAELGVHRSNNIKLLVQKDIPDAVEIGRDGPFMLNGKTPKKGFWGLEKKAQFYIGRWTEEPPEILAEIERKQEPIYKKLGFAGIFSNEVRVTKKGVAYPMDDCCRAPNPPTSTLLKVYGRSYAQAIYDLAHDRLPILKPEYLYGAEIILSSSWHERHEIHIPKVSEELQEWFLLRNVTKRDNGELYCIENKCGGHFGSIVAVGNSVDEVGELVEDRAKQLKVYRMDYTKNFLEEMRPEIEKAKEYAGADLEAKESKKAA